MADLQKVFGASVKRIRVARGLTQAQLAEAIERSVDMVSRLERGDASPSLDTVGALAAVLQADPAELFGGRPMTGNSATPQFESILTRLLAFDEGELTWVNGLLDQIERRPRK